MVRLEGLGTLKKVKDLTGSRTRDLKACSVAPKPSMLHVSYKTWQGIILALRQLIHTLLHDNYLCTYSPAQFVFTAPSSIRKVTRNTLAHTAAKFGSPNLQCTVATLLGHECASNIGQLTTAVPTSQGYAPHRFPFKDFSDNALYGRQTHSAISTQHSSTSKNVNIYHTTLGHISERVLFPKTLVIIKSKSIPFNRP
jgi:hypothetical protein